MQKNRKRKMRTRRKQRKWRKTKGQTKRTMKGTLQCCLRRNMSKNKEMLSEDKTGARRTMR
eukprot:80136-Hanusia_phi.AAC.2